MAAIYTVTNLVTRWNADDVNQYARALNGVLGITFDNQDALGRLIVPTDTAHPAVPITGMVSFRTDLGVGGRLHLRHSNNSGQWVPYLPMRQLVESGFNSPAHTSSSTTYVDVSGLSVSITTTGGRLFIRFVPRRDDYLFDVVSPRVASVGAPATSDRLAYLRAVVGAANLPGILFGDADTASGPALGIFPGHGTFTWDYLPPAPGTYTVKIQGKVGQANGSLAFSASELAIQVIEYGDG